MAVADRRTVTPAPTSAPTAADALAASAAPVRPVALGIGLAVLATVVWSGSFVASRALGDSVPPVQHAFWRWVVALAVVAPFGARRAWRQRALIRRHLGFVLLASLLGVAVYNTLVNQAGVTTPAANMGMIMAASPVLMAVYERAGGVRLGARRVAGLLVACAGVTVRRSATATEVLSLSAVVVALPSQARTRQVHRIFSTFP